jgi:hypothetical protein
VSRPSGWRPAVALRAVAVAFGLEACGDPLPAAPVAPPADHSASDAGPATGLHFIPPAAATAVAPISRLVLQLAEPITTARVSLIRGTLSSAQLHELARPTLSEALGARLVPALIWADGDGLRVTAAPLAALDAGALYTIGVSAPAQAWSFAVSAEPGRTLLARVWPRAGVAIARSAAWCGASALAPFVHDDAVLEPAALAGRFQLGTGVTVPAASCVAWMPQGELELGALPALSPPVLSLGDEDVSLEPVVLLAGDPVVPAAPMVCQPEETPFASACADVQDDRILVRAPEQALLWTIAGTGPVVVRSTAPGERFLLRPLPVPSLQVSTLDAQGQSTTTEVTVVPGAKRSHVVINEVMANPNGPEPQQEWIELYNDGSSAVSLAGYALEDAQGTSVLPDAMLAEGELALIVGPGYEPRPELDPAPPAETKLLRVPALALANDGERLTLRDADGVIVSVFPAIKTKNGVSSARKQPDSDDRDPSAFALSRSPAGSSPGAAN